MRICFVIILSCLFLCEGKVFTRCKLAKALYDLKYFSKSFLGSWVCLIETVSGRDTALVTTSPSGKKSYGLYQIPQEWCKVGKKGGGCDIACESLLDDDIRDDTKCAVKIVHDKGFKYWKKYLLNCKKDRIAFITTEIYKCPEFQ